MVSGCRYRGDKRYRGNKICSPPSEVAAPLLSGQLLMERRREEDIYYSSPLLDGNMDNISFENIPYGGLHAAHYILYRDDPKGTARIWQKMCSGIIT